MTEVIDREEVLPSQPDDGRGMMAQRERVEVLSDESAFYFDTIYVSAGRLASRRWSCARARQISR